MKSRLTPATSKAHALTRQEQKAFKNLESIVATGWEAFVHVGNALSQIRDKQLYRTDFSTFEEYCHQRWHLGKAHAYRLIGAAEVIEDLSPIGDKLPTHEFQVRPLLGLSKEKRVHVWKQVIAQTGDKPITERIVRQVTHSLHAGSKPAVNGFKHGGKSSIRDCLNEALDALNINDTVRAKQFIHQALDSLPKATRRPRSARSAVSVLDPQTASPRIC